MKKINLHTHTTFCDGKCTPEEMVRGAIEKGFDVLGFSVHSPMTTNPDWALPQERLPAYLAEIRRLQTAYADRIEIRNGIELDRAYCGVDLNEFDYVIGAVHQLDCGGRCYDVDESADQQRVCCAREFGGDFLRMAAQYYRTLADFIIETPVDIVAHYDLIEKFNANKAVFDSDAPAYRALALQHLDRILDAKPTVTFEVNTGAMFRVGNPNPYPAPFLLRHLKQRGANLIITSDAHCVEALDFAFDKAAALLQTL